MKSKLLILSLMIVTSVTLSAQSLLPKPTSVIMSDGHYNFDGPISISSPDIFQSDVNIFSEYVECAFATETVRKNSHADISLKENSTLQSDEAYTLRIDKRGIRIEGSRPGVFYGIRTLQQLMDQYGLSLPYVEISDAPRFGWRGLMLDCGRYYFPVEFIKQYIDRMSYYKLNVFHWHLSEDGGWRIEIKSHPELVATSAWRRSTQIDRAGTQNNVPHGGYYTQKQIREIVQYAKERNVTIVPEVDLPGHTVSILAAHPELNCTGKQVFPEIHWRIWDDVLCVGNEGTMNLIKDILSELIDIFDGEYINIGGDEAPHKHWENCPKCKSLMEKEGIETTRGLQSWLTAQMDEFVRSKGRKIIGWDEILEGGKLGKDAAVMSWRNSQSGLDATRLGNKVVMSPTSYMYIDYYQSKDCQYEPFAIGGYLPLDVVYGYEPITSEFSGDQEKLVMGIQANLWCEYVHSPDHAWYMTFPRALACAEIGWSVDRSKNYQDFRDRLNDILYSMDRDQIPFRIPEPVGLDNPVVENGTAHFDLKIPVRGSQIYYTTDGSDPQYNGRLYDGPFALPLSVGGINLRCTVKLPSGRYSAPYSSQKK